MRKTAITGAAILAAILIAPPMAWGCGGSDLGMACCPGLTIPADSCHPQMQVSMPCCEARPAEQPSAVVPVTGSAPLSSPVLAASGADLPPPAPSPAVAPSLGDSLARDGQERLQLFSTLLL